MSDDMNAAAWVPIIVALIALAASVLSPVFVSRAQINARREDRDAGWRRQDEVAERLIESNKLVAAEAKAAAVVVAAEVKVSASETNGKLAIIHTLVDGGLMVALKVAIDSTVLYIEELKKHPEGQTELIAATEKRISEMREGLAQRLADAAVVADQERNQQQAALVRAAPR